jgi:hypothetical protein
MEREIHRTFWGARASRSNGYALVYAKIWESVKASTPGRRQFFVEAKTFCAETEADV